MSESLVRLARQVERGVTPKKRLHGLKFFFSVKGSQLIQCVLHTAQLARNSEQAQGASVNVCV